MSSSRKRKQSTDSKGRSSGKRRKVTDEEIAEYLAKKAHKKANKVGLFVWRKKIERDVSGGVSIDEFSMKADKKRQRDRVAEIEKLKKRREERAVEKAHHEEEMAILARERARAEFHDWEKKEEEFLFDQFKARSEIRFKEGRMKPIDILIRHLDPEPYMIFKGLTVKEMEELHGEIKMLLDLDRAHCRYWKALLVVSEWELAQVRKRDTLERAAVRGEQLPPEMIGEERGLHASIEPEVKNLLHGKTYDELDAYQSEIKSKMRDETANVEYWEAVLKRLHIYRAKACLRDIHAKMPRKHLEYLETPLSVKDNKKEFDRQLDSDQDIEENNEPEALSPVPVVVDVEDQDEQVDEGSYPRKPKYFNRVHTGYVWNKYNQTHYDHDNPPPKFVQGYKFDIFYPDLLNKSIAPKYEIDRDGDETETCIIRFHAGPPYEDIAFKIVNKEWEKLPKKGYKCTFESGILHLYFNFKRYSYRR